MPTETGIYTQEDASIGHDFSYQLARFLGSYFKKNEPIADYGCGKGEYLRYMHDIGFTDLIGYEGTDNISTDFGNIFCIDLTEKMLTDKLRNIVCLEVGEHIPELYLDVFIDNITNNLIKDGKLFISWAIPEQDGIGHVSCRHNIWVINEMEKRGLKFLAEDSLKARSVIEERVKYFRNTILIFQNN